MKTDRILQLLSMAATCLLFTSCFDSKVPLSDPAKSKPDERLVGVWRHRNEDGSVAEYRIDHAEGKLPASVMRARGSVRKPNGTTEQLFPGPLLLFPTTIGGKSYLSIAFERERSFSEDKGLAVTGYLIWRYQVMGDVLTVEGIDGDAKSEAIKAGKIKGVIEKDQQGNPKICFTDTTENLVKFVVEAGDDLFRKDVVRLERMK